MYRSLKTGRSKEKTQENERELSLYLSLLFACLSPSEKIALSFSFSLSNPKPNLLDVVEHGRAPRLHSVHPLESGARGVDAARVGALAVVGLFFEF